MVAERFLALAAVVEAVVVDGEEAAVVEAVVVDGEEPSPVSPRVSSTIAAQSIKGGEESD